MGFLNNHRVALRRMMAGCAILGLATVGVASAPQPAHAWWRGGYGWCCSVGIGIPPVVVAPPVYVAPQTYVAPTPYYPAPAYVTAPRPVWVPPHWEGGYYIAGHWG